jgi:hypothetical protein
MNHFTLFLSIFFTYDVFSDYRGPNVHSMEQSPSSEADSHSTSQVIPRFL